MTESEALPATGLAVRLRPLSLVEEDEEVLVGDPESGTFVSLPRVGGVVITALQRGATVEEAATAAAEFAGEPVDVPGFVEVLRELGFVDDGSEAEAVRSAPIQQRRWLHGVSQAAVRPFFGRVAWTLYGLCALAGLTLLITRPSLFPRPSDAFVLGGDDIGLAALLLYPLLYVLPATHEAGHWLAARALGVSARFGVDRRMVFLVFETDLSQLWTRPKRERYGPLFGGMAVDSVLLAVVLGSRTLADLGLWSPPGLVRSALATLTFVLVAQFFWQSMVFLRTDLYAVLINTLGCRNLWRVKTLLLRRAFGRLTDSERAELDGSTAADLRAGGWFRWLWLAGFAGVAAWAGYFMAPLLWTTAAWTLAGISEGPMAGAFWYALICGVLFFAPLALVLALAVREWTRNLLGRPA